MIFIPRLWFILGNLCAAAAIILLGLLGYTAFAQHEAYTAMQAKMTSEWFLFGMIVALLLLALIIGRTLFIRKKVSTELRRIRSMSSFISLSTQLNSKKLYELGPPLAELFERVSSINEKQALKMSAQHSLISFLCANINAPLLITDVTGKILDVSFKYESTFKTERAKLIDKNIETIVPNLFIQEVLNNIQFRQKYKREQLNDLSFHVYPIYNRSPHITYLIFELGSDSDFSYTAGAGPQTTLPAVRENPLSDRISKQLKKLKKLITPSS